MLTPLTLITLLAPIILAAVAYGFLVRRLVPRWTERVATTEAVETRILAPSELDLGTPDSMASGREAA